MEVLTGRTKCRLQARLHPSLPPIAPSHDAYRTSHKHTFSHRYGHSLSILLVLQKSVSSTPETRRHSICCSNMLVSRTTWPKSQPHAPFQVRSPQKQAERCVRPFTRKLQNWLSHLESLCWIDPREPCGSTFWRVSVQVLESLSLMEHLRHRY